MNDDDPDDDSPSNSGQMGLLELAVLPLFRYKSVVLAATVIGLVGAACWAALQPNYYISMGKVHYIPGVSETSAPTSLETEGTARITNEALQNEIQILNSTPLYEKVALKLGPDVVLRAYDPHAVDGPDTSWAIRTLHDFQGWWYQEEPVSSAAESKPDGATGAVPEQSLEDAVALLQEFTSITAIDFSSVLRVSYQSHDQHLAQLVATQILTECINRHTEIFYSNKAIEVLNLRLQEVISARTKAEGDLKVFQKDCGFTNMTVEQDRLINDHADVQKEVNQLEASIAKVEAELKVLVEQSALMPAQIEQITPSALVTNAEYTKVSDRLQKKRDDRETYVNKYGDQTDAVKVMDKEISELEDLLSKTPSKEIQAQQKVLVPNPTRESIEGEIRASTKTLAGLREELNQRKFDAANFEDEIDRSTDCEFELKAHENTVDRLQKLEGKLQVELENQEQAHAIQNANISNLILLEPATYPAEKSGPKRDKLILMGLAGGFAVGAMLALALRILNPRLQEPEEMERICPASVLIILSKKRQLKK